MNKTMRYCLALLLMLIALGAGLLSGKASAALTVVKGVLFYSPNCGHCHKVINEDLPPLIQKYGERLVLIGINTSVPEGQQLYQAAIKHFNIPDNRLGVPTLIVGTTVLVGSLEIPEQLPGLIEAGLAEGGIDWPDIPGLKEVIAEEQVVEEEANESAEASAPTAIPEPTTAKTEVLTQQVTTGEITLAEKFSRDLTGNILAVTVLVGMVFSLGWTGYAFARPFPRRIGVWPSWTIPLLALVGMGIAAYLSYVEVTHSAAVCGPVGDCNTVQQSAYARLFGVLPVGVLGLVGYITIFITWLVSVAGPQKLKVASALVLWGLALFATIFSIYLTFLEPFVIGATCMWCVSSAVVTTLVLWAATGLAINVWRFEDDDEIQG